MICRILAIFCLFAAVLINSLLAHAWCFGDTTMGGYLPFLMVVGSTILAFVAGRLSRPYLVVSVVGN